MSYWSDQRWWPGTGCEDRTPREKELAMKVRIEDTCTACGLCCDTCPEVFEMGDEIATCIVDEVPPSLKTPHSRRPMSARSRRSSSNRLVPA
jgi:Na+-translocating ferredoxin:NAD+ oxidoreductase RNF subunit RnfB